MGTSKAQRDGIVVACKCGCGESFKCFPVYRSKAEGGGLRIPEYKRGHHPNCRANQTGTKPSWNAGLTKEDHPSIARMGFQPGHAAHTDWTHVNKRIATDPEFKARWRNNKKGQVAWNTGITKAKYKNGIASGPKHGNWKGGHNGFRDTAEWKTVRREVFQRDKWTCQDCGDRNRAGRGSRISLECHHKIPSSVDPTLALVKSNLITLCSLCHLKAHGKKSKKAAP